MSPVQKMQQEISTLRQKGCHKEADNLQRVLDSHQNEADSADEALRLKQEKQLKAMGLL